MKTLKIKTEDFIDWYLNAGSDQEQESTLIELGRSIAEQLTEGKVTITPETLLEQCDYGMIRLNLIEGFEDADPEYEVYDAHSMGIIGRNFKIEFIK
jgi:hypothetical protein